MKEILILLLYIEPSLQISLYVPKFPY
jgi:hypothetical protein